MLTLQCAGARPRQPRRAAQAAASRPRLRQLGERDRIRLPQLLRGDDAAAGGAREECVVTSFVLRVLELVLRTTG